jgi:hypothetical protein
MHMRRQAARLIRIPVLVLALSGAGLPARPAGAAPGPPPTAAGAAAIFYRSTASFLVYKANHVAGYNWTDDGCSVPSTLKFSVPALAFASRRFVAECAQHDFAYRNFGGTMRLDPSEARRRSVDKFFYARLKDRCRAPDIVHAHRKTLCLAYARIFYAAVRTFGRL